jgi:hypothetical protein
VFKAVKAAAAGMGLERVFITGVSPIAMSDITSAYNIASNIYLLPDFNGLCGFTEDEIIVALERIGEEHDLSADEVTSALDMMRTFYDGYRFSSHVRIKEHMYNPTLALYFLRYFYNYGEYPNNILDENMTFDSNKIHYIAGLADGREVIGMALDDTQTLEIPHISERFGVQRMHNAVPDKTFVASLLYYLGALTHTSSPMLGTVVLRVPNLVMRKLYLEEIAEILLPDAHSRNEILKISQALYIEGNIAPLCNFLQSRVFTAFSNRDYNWTNELTIKTTFLAALFNDRLFVMDSEPELQRGYADLTMIVRPDIRHYGQLLDVLLEFKYIKISDSGLKNGDAVLAASDETLHALPCVQKAFTDAQIQLDKYIPRLQKKYGDTMKLCVFAVVAVGFDRLLWREITTNK